MALDQRKAEERRAFYSLVIPLMIAELVAALELTMIYAAMRSLVADFGGTSQAGWLVTAFLLSSAAGAAMFGRLGDLLGRRNILLWVLALSTIGSLVSSLTRELEWLILGRTLQGFAGAIVPLCFSIIRERANPERVGLGIGLISSTVTIASASGLVIGGMIIDYADWTMIFKISSGLGLFAFLIVFLLVAKDTLRTTSGLLNDLLGGMLFIPAVVSLLLGITHSARHGVLDPTSLAWFAGAAIATAAWIWRELSVNDPLLDVRLLAKPDIAWPNIMMIFIAIGAYQGGQIMSLFGQQSPATGIGLGLTATLAGALLLPGNLFAGATAPFVSGVVDRYGPRHVARFGCGLVCLAFGLLAIFNDNVLVVVVLMIVQGIGIGIVYVVTPIIIVNATPADRVGEATGMMSVIRSTAMAIGAQTVAALLAVGTGGHAGAADNVLPDAAAYTRVFVFVSAMGFVAMLICQMLPKSLQSLPGGKPAESH